MAHTILILEDDRMAREAIMDYLSAFGWNVLSAASTQSAMHLADQAKPDLAICDWQLGETATGIDVARQLQKRFGTRIILVSARSLHELEKSSSDIDVVRYFSKPLSLESLRRTILSASP